MGKAALFLAGVAAGAIATVAAAFAIEGVDQVWRDSHPGAAGGMTGRSPASWATGLRYTPPTPPSP